MSATASNGGGAVSLEAAVRTCKVVTGWANKIQSDRFQNPNLMVCPVWNGVDTAGRRVCPDSFWTKRAGCNSAEDRVMVENNVSRPQYMEYVNLNAAGIAAPIYAQTLPYKNENHRTDGLNNVHKLTGQFGLQTEFGQNIYPGCNMMGSSRGPSAYDQTYPTHQKPMKYFPEEKYQMAQHAQARRQAQSMQNGFGSHQRRVAAGF